MNSARQQITKREWTRVREGKQADMSKTSPGRVDKAGCVVVCCDTVRFTSCEALAMVNKNVVVQIDGLCGVYKAGGMTVWCGGM